MWCSSRIWNAAPNGAKNSNLGRPRLISGLFTNQVSILHLLGFGVVFHLILPEHKFTQSLSSCTSLFTAFSYASPSIGFFFLHHTPPLILFIAYVCEKKILLPSFYRRVPPSTSLRSRMLPEPWPRQHKNSLPFSVVLDCSQISFLLKVSWETSM